MSLYRIDLAYVGTDFNGWQSQPDGSGVQDAIEKALKQLLQQKIRLTGASRTDSGVHAKHQVATFKWENELDTYKFKASLNALLPHSIGIASVEKTSDDFHPIGSCTSKIYKYSLWTSRSRDPFAEPYIWRVPKDIDMNLTQQASKIFIGTHNFKAFCASDSCATTFERTILDIKFNDLSPLIEIEFCGTGFLKQMIRTLVGTLVLVGLNRLSLTELSSILSSQDRTKAGQTAPAKGLTLMKIIYS